MKTYIYTLIAFAAIATGCKSTAPKTQEPVKEEYSAVTTCGAGGSHAGHAHAAKPAAPKSGEAEEEHGDEIIFPVSQASKCDFKVEQIEPTTMSNIIRCSGQIIAAQGDEVSVVAPVSGVISLSGVKLTSGAAVGKGSKLFYITSKNIATGDAAAKSAATFRKAEADYLRAKKLVGDKIVSQKEFDQIELDYNQAKAEYDALAAAQSARGTAVSTPIGGYVTILTVSDGDYVEMGQPLAVVSQNKRLVLRAEVSQRYYGDLKTIRTASFREPFNGHTYQLSQLNGRLLSVGKSSATGSTLIPVSFEFDNRDGVVPGSYVDVFLQGAPLGGALAVPVSAITEQQGVFYLYVQLDQEGYQRREVTLGVSDGERVQILSGITAGERVVTRGAINVKMAAASGAIPAGHNH